VALSVAMEEDEFLLDAAGWARYYERAYEQIQNCLVAKLTDPPPREVIDDPQAFARWVEYCERLYMARNQR
jgi:hypothetical protein